MTNFKTIKCRYYELGICKYSEGCHFAHGDNDSKVKFIHFKNIIIFYILTLFK